MFTKAALAAALALTASVASAGVGALPANLTLAERVTLSNAYEDNDKAQINFILSRAEARADGNEYGVSSKDAKLKAFSAHGIDGGNEANAFKAFEAHVDGERAVSDATIAFAQDHLARDLEDN